MDEVLRTWPTSCRSIVGTKLWMPLRTPQVLTPSTHSMSPRVVSQIGECGPPTPALLQRTCTAPNASVPQGIDLIRVGHVGDDGPDVRAVGVETLDRSVQCRLLDVGQDDPDALCKEPLGQAQPDAAGRSRHHGDPSRGDHLVAAHVPRIRLVSLVRLTDRAGT